MNDETKYFVTMRRTSDGAQQTWETCQGWEPSTVVYVYRDGDRGMSCNRMWAFEERDCGCTEDGEDPDCTEEAYPILHIKDADGDIIYAEGESPEALYCKLKWGGR